MSVVKIKFVQHLKNLVRYVADGRGPSDPVDCYNCSPSMVAQDFDAMARLHQGRGAINAVHIVQSWNEGESKKLFPVEANELGKMLVERKFPGHAFAVITHTDTGKTHNHIIVSPWHSETGKKIANKKIQLYQLRDINDAIARERGLSVVGPPRSRDQLARMPEKVQKMMQYNGRSWLLDLCQKADFARAYATSYDEYAGILKEFGVKARVEEKNVSYFYPGKERGKRGSKLGHLYDKKGLEEAFKANDLKLAAFPNIRERLWGETGLPSSLEKAKKAALFGYAQGYKDYSRFTPTAREGRPQRHPHELDLRTSLVPIDEIRRARMSSILTYCDRNKVALERNREGKFVLKGRPFVEVSDYDWVNRKNRTKGTLIEFVAAHKKLTFLQAIAEINGNRRLLQLEDHFGEVKRNFTSFYVPKHDRAGDENAVTLIGKWLLRHGCDRQHAKTFFNSGQVQVDRAGVIHLFGKDDDGGRYQFTEGANGAWQRERKGSFSKPFFASHSLGRKVRVYTDPFLFLKHYGGDVFSKARSHSDVICLMEPDHKVLDKILACHGRIDRVDFITFDKDKRTGREVDFFHTLNTKSRSFGIQADIVSGEKALPSRGRGFELSL